MRAFPTMERAFSASVTDLLEAGIEPEIANRFLQERLHIHPDQELEKMIAAEVKAVTRAEETYPSLLAQLYDPPAILFYRGTLPDQTRKHIAVVGSREVTAYGARAIETIVGPLAESGVVIVSGLAYGVDALAHRITIDRSGTTLAVLGTGVDAASIYPSANRTLASQILASGGAILSEFPIGTPPLKHHFPIRNRVIAGLCHGTLVIEAAQKSGSLITARAALEAGRDVYAVPGLFDAPLSEGPNNLIKMGATLVTQASDIVSSIEHPKNIQETKSFVYEARNETERILLSFLSTQPTHIDEIAHACILPIETISSTLTLLEMKGIIRHEGGRYYVRIS